MTRQVVVIGGGLAGITAAIALRDAGVGVTVLESRPRLGGAASSYARGPMTIDNGQHVFLRCCTSYQELLARLGMTGSVAIQDRFDVTVLSQAGSARLRRSALPSPLHLAGALARYRLLSLPERAGVARAALGFRFADPASPALDRERLGDWLAARGQGERARRRLWDLFVVSALNVAGDDASLQLAATVIKTALLGAKDAADIGMAMVPLGDLHATAAARLLAQIGVRVRLGTRVAAVERLAGGAFRVEPAHGELADAVGVVADGVVLAVPPAQAARLAGTAGLPPAPAWADLRYSPIVNVHVIYDRRVTGLPFAAAVDSPVQWVFDKTRPAGTAQRPVPGSVVVGGRQLRRQAGGGAQGPVRAGPGTAVPGSCRGRHHRLLRDQGTSRDVPAGARFWRPATRRRDRGAGTGAGRCVDRHRLAGHHGGCGAKRASCRASADQRAGTPGRRHGDHLHRGREPCDPAGAGVS